MPRTDDLRIRELKELIPPSHLIREFQALAGHAPVDFLRHATLDDESISEAHPAAS